MVAEIVDFPTVHILTFDVGGVLFVLQTSVQSNENPVFPKHLEIHKSIDLDHRTLLNNLDWVSPSMNSSLPHKNVGEFPLAFDLNLEIHPPRQSVPTVEVE